MTWTIRGVVAVALLLGLVLGFMAGRIAPSGPVASVPPPVVPPHVAPAAVDRSAELQASEALVAALRKELGELEVRHRASEESLRRELAQRPEVSPPEKSASAAATAPYPLFELKSFLEGG